MTHGGARALDAALLAAHAADDRRALVRLYTDAADLARSAGETDRACFYLTHAYIHALEAADPQADSLRARLRTEGREA